MMNEITASRKYEAAPRNGSRMNSAACKRNITKKTHLRPMASENQAHRNRPEALPTEMMLTSPAATVALTPASATAIGDASGYVEEQQRPQHVPLPGPQSVAEVVVYARGFAALLGVRFPPLGRPTLGRIPHEKRCPHNHHQVDDAENGERPERSERGDEPRGDQRRYERPAAEACHGDARYEAALVGEPLDERRDGHDVAETYAGAGDEAVGQIEEHEAVRGETSQEDPDPVEGASR